MNEPRITPLPREEWTEEVSQAIGALLPANASRPLRREKGGSQGHNALGTLARHPQHVVLAADAGLDHQEIARIAEGADAPGWSPLDAAMLRAVDELVSDAMITDATWKELAGEFDEHQLMDLIFTVGAYDLLAMAFRSFGVELDEDLQPS